MRIKSGLLALGVALLVFSLDSCSNTNNGTTTSTGFMWVATQGDQMVSSYTIDLGNGSVSSARSSTASGPNPTAMALTPDGTTLFVANVDENVGTSQAPSYVDQVRPFPINQSDGTIGAVATPVQITANTFSTPQGMALAMAVDPSGKFLFVTHQGNAGVVGAPGTVEGSISVFTISGTGLSPVGSPVLTTLPGDVTANGPTAIAVSSSYLYVADQFSSVVAAYSYDANGNLTFLNSYPVPANPSALAFSRVPANSNRDNYLIVANIGSAGGGQVTVFNACVAATLTCSAPTGLLTQASSVSANGSSPVGVIVDPAFDWVYVIDKKSSQVSQFSFAGATGVVTALSPSAVSVGASPVSGGVTRDGNWVFIANNGQSNLSALGVSSAGKLSPANTASVILSNQPSAIVVR